MQTGILRRAALLLAGGAALSMAGCGSGTQATQTGLRLQREDLIATAQALGQAQGEVAREVAATKSAWPLVANGLPAEIATEDEAKIATAARLALALKLPGVLDERRSEGLTGAGASLAGTFRSFAELSGRGWQMIQASYLAGRSDTSAASFDRANVALYIESVYDAHFGLAQIGKKLLAGYEKLGGPAIFGSSLPRAEVERLARAYSESSCRLHPHAGVKLGS
ncbi:MAG TPA: hypothetical protein VH061_05325 [Solirubrobacteraceae bacterium]|nr:hypothetical protein [Solirubrobacteraceae bacterium]